MVIGLMLITLHSKRYKCKNIKFIFLSVALCSIGYIRKNEGSHALQMVTMGLIVGWPTSKKGLIKEF